MKIFGFPAAAWVTILVFVTTWLQTYLTDSEVNWWVPTAIAIIGGIIKAIELMSEPAGPPPGALSDSGYHEQPNKLTRWLVGP